MNARHIALTSHSIQDLPFQKVKHAVQTLDAQPSSGEGGIIVMVTGALIVRLPFLPLLPIHCYSPQLNLLSHQEKETKQHHRIH